VRALRVRTEKDDSIDPESPGDGANSHAFRLCVESSG
jgi:hypothetical protein